MAQYTLEDVLSMYGRIPEMQDPEFAGLRYTTMVAYAPKTENGAFLVELARAGLAREFLQKLQTWYRETNQSSCNSAKVVVAAHAMADEYVDAMLERQECIETPNTAYMNMITSALTMCTSRFVKHVFPDLSKEDLSQKWRTFHIQNPDEFGPILLAWFNRPIPLQLRITLNTQMAPEPCSGAIFQPQQISGFHTFVEGLNGFFNFFFIRTNVS